VAFDVYPLDNSYQDVGSGMTGEFEKVLTETEFLDLVKKAFKLKVVKHTPFLNKPVKKVAFCGGSGSFLIKNAINSGSDAYISADIKYHEYFDADGKILIADTGHFENEQFTPEIFYDLFRKKFTTFATYLSKVNTNPVNYF
jgi:putative NIF3 family GTP cyclohydrolase 1 type 2